MIELASASASDCGDARDEAADTGADASWLSTRGTGRLAVSVASSPMPSSLLAPLLSPSPSPPPSPLRRDRDRGRDRTALTLASAACQSAALMTGSSSCRWSASGASASASAAAVSASGASAGEGTSLEAAIDGAGVEVANALSDAVACCARGRRGLSRRLGVADDEALRMWGVGRVRECGVRGCNSKGWGGGSTDACADAACVGGGISRGSC